VNTVADQFADIRLRTGDDASPDGELSPLGRHSLPPNNGMADTRGGTETSVAHEADAAK